MEFDDAGCEPGLEGPEAISDEDTKWLVLFASVIPLGRAYVLERAQDWRELFDGPLS